MSNEDWVKLKSWWGCDLFSSFNLEIDGHKVTLQNHTYKMKISVAVYVDDYFKGSYLDMNDPIGKKFYPTKTKNLYSKKQMDELIKDIGKKRAEKLQSIYSYKDCYWKSFNSFKRHLNANCDNIKIKEDE